MTQAILSNIYFFTARSMLAAVFSATGHTRYEQRVRMLMRSRATLCTIEGFCDSLFIDRIIDA